MYVFLCNFKVVENFALAGLEFNTSSKLLVEN